MRQIHVSDIARRAIVELAILPFKETGTRQPNGDWLLPVAKETWERLEQQRISGASATI